MKRVILARHGNTFEPGQTPLWVGARTDLPLAEKGRAQAQALGEGVRKAGISLMSILTGPLQRTQQTAQIAAAIAGVDPARVAIDARLTEIDYGLWEGKSTEEIVALGGEAELTAWNLRSEFPIAPHWHPVEGQLLANALTLLNEVDEGAHLIVTSNGILRFFARAAANAAAFPDRKVATGHVCVLEQASDWRIVHWNETPEVLTQG